MSPPKNPPAPEAETVQEEAPGVDMEGLGLDPMKVIQRISASGNLGELMVRNAVQSCVIDKQQEDIEALKKELMEVSRNGRTRSRKS